MDKNQYIIKIDDKDKSKEIDEISLSEDGKSYRIIYKNTLKVYNYSKSRVSKYERPKPAKRYTGNVLEYLKQVTEVLPNGLSTDSQLVKNEKPEPNFLWGQLEKINCIEGQSILYDYLTKKDCRRTSYDTSGMIYPFGCNKSQLSALRNSLTSNFSIIEGPPGTGKTQTILNIIANVIKDNKTIAIVSGNNSATANVAEKLIQKGYGDMVAILGNKDNRKTYFSVEHTSISKFKDVENDKLVEIQQELAKNTPKLEKLLELDNELHELKRNMFQVQFESETFQKSRKLIDLSRLEQLFKNKEWSSRKWLSLRDCCEAWKNQDKYAKNGYVNARVSDVRIWINTLFKHQFRIDSLKIPSVYDISDYASMKFYEIKKIELEQKETYIDHELKGLKSLLERQQELSKYILHNKINKNISREELDLNEANYKYKANFKAFIKQVPIILSTTNSIKQSVAPDFIFDYLVIDEASQVDLITASLALSCTKNIIIVGDEKQLPHIVSNPIQINKLSEKIDAIFNYTNHSILTSIKQLPLVPCVTLREHYRCNPLIIDFCNQRFYDGQLIIKKEWSKDNPFEIYTTDRKKQFCVMRNGQNKIINPDQHSKSIEVVKSILHKEGVSDDDICVIAPYRAYVNTLQVDLPKIAIDTVHKFQGREKKTVIISTVQDENIEDEFMNNSNLVNVAVSRAENELKLICGYNLYKNASLKFNMGALINYMKYYSSNVIFHSIFDNLYDSNLSDSRKVYLAKLYGSKFNSENLIHELLKNDILKDRSDIGVLFNYPLRYVVEDEDILNDEELLFISRSSHIDFFLFNKIDKSPLLAIEVNGQQHKQTIQANRDLIKKNILFKCDIELLSLDTIGCNEREQIVECLQKIA